MDWAGVRAPTDPSAEKRLRTVLSSFDFFETPLHELLQSPELARIAVSMSGTEIQRVRSTKMRDGTRDDSVRIGRFVARIADGRFVSSAWAREREGGAGNALRSVLKPEYITEAHAEADDMGFDQSEAGPRDANLRGESIPFAATQPHARTATSDVGGSESMRWNRPRSGYSNTLLAVREGQDEAVMPTWARRASGEPLTREERPKRAVVGQEANWIRALVRANTQEAVLGLMLDQEQIPAATLSNLSSPALQVIEQIRTEAHRVDSELGRGEVIQGKGRNQGVGRSSRSTDLYRQI